MKNADIPKILDALSAVIKLCPSLKKDSETSQSRTTYKIPGKSRQCVEVKEFDQFVLVRFTAPISQFPTPAVPITDLSGKPNYKQWKTEFRLSSLIDAQHAQSMFLKAYNYAIGDK